MLRFSEHCIKHRLRELSGKRVLLARMKRAEKSDSVVQLAHRAMGKLGSRLQRGQSKRSKCVEGVVKSNFPEPDHHFDPIQEFDFSEEVWSTVEYFLRK